MAEVADDFVLLRRYAADRDQAAFAELAQRHVNLVYSSALRRVGDRHLAEDVTQATFVILAQKAKSIAHGRDGPLSAWLLTAVRYASSNAIKMEARRRKYEDEAREARGFDACSANPTDVLVWHEISDVLDDAVLKLPSLDRRAVLLRYFENRNIADIASELNVTEGAAKQRLSRAIDKLRQKLAKHGAMLSAIDSTTLAALLASHAVRAAPAGVMQTACAAATVGTLGTGAGYAIAKGAIKMMAWTKTQMVATVVAVATIGGTGSVIAVKTALGQDRARTPVANAAAPKSKAETPPGQFDKKANNGVVSVADAPPVVVSTVPASGATDVDASAVTELKVTFSKDMETGNFAWVRFGKDTFPQTTGKPRFLDDKRTCVLPVKLEPGHPYVVWLNKPPYDSFMDTDSHKAVQYLLVFETKK